MSEGCLGVCVCVHMYMYMYVYIYIYIERETYIYMYIDMYSLIEGVRCSLGSGFSLQSSASKNAKILKKPNFRSAEGSFHQGPKYRPTQG